MKKLFVLTLVFALILTMFTACKNENDQTAATTPTAATGTTEDANSLKGKKIVVARWGGNDAETTAFAKMLEEFTAETGITAEEKVYTDFDTQLKADLIAESAPDVFYVDANMAPFYIDQGVLREIDPDAVEADKFYSSLTDAFMKDGKLYAVSKDYSTLALYYNKKWVSEDEIPATQEELYGEEFLGKIQARLPEGVIALTYLQDLARLLDILEIDGTEVVRDGNLSNLGSPAVINNLKTIFDAAVAKRILTTADLGMGWNGEAFGNERTAMMVEGNWVYGTLKQEFPDVDFGIVEMPTYKGKKTTMVFTVGYAIGKDSKEPEAALEFIKFATGPKGMRTWCEGAGVLPSRSDVAADMGVDKDPYLAPHIAGADYAKPWQKGDSISIINREFQNYFNSAVKGEMTLEEVMKKAEEEANKQIAR
ncbi:MAG: extracellular solute-binding protein [Clostridiaceae bacterium]|nr:extracellular solute-binding protein [Clostridiaceae bacterium]